MIEEMQATPANYDFEFPAPDNFNSWQLAATPTWVNSMSPGQEILSMALSSYLANFNAFFRHGKSFRAWTFDAIEFKVAIDSVSANYGAVRVAWCPIWKPLNENWDLYQCSQISSKVLYAASGEGCSAVIPLTGTNRKLSLDSIQNYCALHMFVERPLGNIDGTAAQIQLSVYIRPINLRFLDKRPNDARTVTGLTNSSTILTLNWQPTAIAQGGEQVAKSSRGLISGVAEDVQAVANMAGKFPLFSPVASTVSAVAGAVGSVAKWFGLGKPTTMASVTRTVGRMGTHLAGTSGLDPSSSLWTDPDSKLPIDVAVFAESEDISNFQFIASRPSLIQTGTIPNNATNNALAVTVNSNPATIYSNGATPPAQLETNCAFVLNQFSLWRGKVRFIVHLPVDAFTKGTLILLATPGTLPATLTPASYGDYYTEVLQVTGPTVREIILPQGTTERVWYNRSCTAGAVETNYQYNVGLYVTQPFKTAGIACNVPYTIEIAVDDLEVMLPCNRPITNQGLFSGAKQPSLPSSVLTMHVSSFRELFRRYCLASGAAGGNPWEGNSEVKRIMKKFGYWKGSRRNTYYFAVADSTVPTLVRFRNYYGGDTSRFAAGPFPSISQSQGGMAGDLVQNVAQDPEVTIEIPFVSIRKYLPTPRLSNSVWTDCMSVEYVPPAATTVTQYVAFGDDMQFGVLLPSQPYFVT